MAVEQGRWSLRTGGRPVEVVRARLPTAHTATVTFGSVWAAIFAVDLALNVRRIRTARRQSASSGLPLDRRMVMVATPDHLLVWRSGLGPLRKASLLAEVRWDQVAGARLPYVGGRWRTVDLALAAGGGVRFVADRRRADRFVEIVNLRAGRRPGGEPR